MIKKILVVASLALPLASFAAPAAPTNPPQPTVQKEGYPSTVHSAQKSAKAACEAKLKGQKFKDAAAAKAAQSACEKS